MNDDPLSLNCSKPKFKYGDTRSDGYRFLNYRKVRRASGKIVLEQTWLSPASFQKQKSTRKIWVENNRLRFRESRLKRTYGISVHKYEEMLCDQGGSCAICEAKKCASNNRLAVDHSHVTGAVRGLLCSNCNTALGKFQDRPELLLRAYEYLLRSFQQN